MKLFFELFTNELIEKLLSFSFPISLYVDQIFSNFDNPNGWAKMDVLNTI